MDVSIEYMGAVLRAEYVGQNRDLVEVDDEGCTRWVPIGYTLDAAGAQTGRFPPGRDQLRLRNSATTGGVNVEFPGGKVRVLVNYISRESGEPGTRTGTVLRQRK